MGIRRRIGSFAVAGLFLVGCSTGGEIHSGGFDQPFDTLGSAFLVNVERWSNGQQYGEEQVMLFSNLKLEESEVTALLRLEPLVRDGGYFDSKPDPEWCRFYLEEYRQALEELGDVAVNGTTVGVLYFDMPEEETEESGEYGLVELEAGTYGTNGYSFDLFLAQFFGEPLGLYRDILIETCPTVGDELSGKEALGPQVQSQEMSVFLDSRQFWLDNGGRMGVQKLKLNRWEISLSDIKMEREYAFPDTRPDTLPENVGLYDPTPTPTRQTETIPDATIYDAVFELKPMSTVIEYIYEDGE